MKLKPGQAAIIKAIQAYAFPATVRRYISVDVEACRIYCTMVSETTLFVQPFDGWSAIDNVTEVLDDVMAKLGEDVPERFRLAIEQMGSDQ